MVLLYTVVGLVLLSSLLVVVVAREVVPIPRHQVVPDEDTGERDTVGEEQHLK